MAIQAPSAITMFVTTLEQFLSKIEAFLDNHYECGSDSEDIQKMLYSVDNFRYEIDREGLKQEFNLIQEKKDYLSGKDF